MESIKAIIQGEGINSSVEFSVEEVIARQQGQRWGELSEAEQRATLKEYALSLFSRQNGATTENLRVTLEGGTFSEVQDGAV